MNRQNMWALQQTGSTNSLIGPAGLSDVGWQKQTLSELHNALHGLNKSAYIQADFFTPTAALQICSGLCPVKSQPESVSYTYARTENKTSVISAIGNSILKSRVILAIASLM